MKKAMKSRSLVTWIR